MKSIAWPARFAGFLLSVGCSLAALSSGCPGQEIVLSGMLQESMEVGGPGTKVVVAADGVTVTGGKTLTILPGTHVITAPRSTFGTIYVVGTLHVQGTSSDPVVIDARIHPPELMGLLCITVFGGSVVLDSVIVLGDLFVGLLGRPIFTTPVEHASFRLSRSVWFGRKFQIGAAPPETIVNIDQCELLGRRFIYGSEDEPMVHGHLARAKKLKLRIAGNWWGSDDAEVLNSKLHEGVAKSPADTDEYLSVSEPATKPIGLISKEQLLGALFP